VRGIRGSFSIPDRSVENGAELPAEFYGLIHPLTLSGLGLAWRGIRSSMPGPRIVLGDLRNFDDLVLTWNLLAEVL
jgi:hypothetical protein